MVKFFTKDEQQQIIDKIREVEKRTSGEIRVHLARNAGDLIFREAVRVFQRLGMQDTKARNGVLIYMAPKDHRFAIVGDKGIDAVLPEHFWKDVVEEAEGQFRQGKFLEGVCGAIDRIGEHLKAHFPYEEGDVNELPDELSFD